MKRLNYVIISFGLWVLAEAHVYLGCGSVDFPAGNVSCTSGATIFQSNCEYSLTGTIFEKATQCAALCLINADYKAFSIQKSTSCLCTTNLPGVKSMMTQALDCAEPDVVFTLQEALRPNFLLRLERADQRAVTAGGNLKLQGFRPRSTTSLDQNFFLARCSGADAVACVGKAQAWKGIEEIKSGDIVALVSQKLGKSYSCGAEGCQESSFPPMTSSALFRITKLVRNVSVALGSPINFDDEVSLYRDETTRIVTSTVARTVKRRSNLNCDETTCVFSEMRKPALAVGGKFKLVKSQVDRFVTPNAMIKLMQGGRAASFKGMKYSLPDTTTNWFLSKCDGALTSGSCDTSHRAMNTGDNTWVMQETINSGDIVAWVSQETGFSQSMNCVTENVPCWPLTHPPLPGYQGALFKIIKVIGDAPVRSGTPIRFGDEVYFYSMDLLHWISSRILHCGDKDCQVTGKGTISKSKFYIMEAPTATCASYRCPTGIAPRMARAASTQLSDLSCCLMPPPSSDSSDDDDAIPAVAYASSAAFVVLCCCSAAMIIFCRRRSRHESSTPVTKFEKGSASEGLVSSSMAISDIPSREMAHFSEPLHDRAPLSIPAPLPCPIVVRPSEILASSTEKAQISELVHDSEHWSIPIPPAYHPEVPPVSEWPLEPPPPPHYNAEVSLAPETGMLPPAPFLPACSLPTAVVSRNMSQRSVVETPPGTRPETPSATGSSPGTPAGNKLRRIAQAPVPNPIGIPNPTPPQTPVLNREIITLENGKLRQLGQSCEDHLPSTIEVETREPSKISRIESESRVPTKPSKISDFESENRVPTKISAFESQDVMER